MSQAALEKWEAILDEARKKLGKGGDKLEAAAILRDKQNTRDVLVSTIINIVNCGHALAKDLSEKEHLAASFQLKAAGYKQTCNEKAATISSFNEKFDEIKRSLENNYREHGEKLDTIQSNLDKHIESYADILKSQPTSGSSTTSDGDKKLQSVVNAALLESNEKTLRSSRFVIYGLEGREKDFLADAEDIVHTVLGYRHPVVAVNPINNKQSSPILVQLKTPELVSRVLKQAKKLRSTSHYRNIYLAPDRTPEEQRRYKKLVDDLKNKIKEDSSRWWYIKDGGILSTDLRELSNAQEYGSNSDSVQMPKTYQLPLLKLAEVRSNSNRIPKFPLLQSKAEVRSNSDRKPKFPNLPYVS